MEDQSKHMDDLFREALGNYTEQPDPAVWNRLEQRLDAASGGRRSFFLRWWFIGLLLLVLFGGGYFLLSRTWQSHDRHEAQNDRVAHQAERFPAAAVYPAAQSPAPASGHHAQNPGHTAIQASGAHPIAQKQAGSPAQSGLSGKANSGQRAETAHPPAPSNQSQTGMDAANRDPKKEYTAALSRKAAGSPAAGAARAGSRQEAAQNTPARKRSNPAQAAASQTATFQGSNTPRTNTQAAPDQQSPTAADKTARQTAAKAVRQETAPVATSTTPTTPGKAPANPATPPSAASPQPPPAPAVAGTHHPSRPEASGQAPVADPSRRDGGIAVSDYLNKAEARDAETSEEEADEADEPEQQADEPDEPVVSLATGSGGDSQPQAAKPKRNRVLEAGVKAGYETGLRSDPKVHTYVVSPYLKYKISPRLGIVVQPGFKLSQLARGIQTAGQSYYRVNSSTVQGIGNMTQDTLSFPPVYRQDYLLSQSYDSVRISATSDTRFISFETPLMLQYQLSKRFSVLGGMNMSIGRILKLHEHRQFFQRSISDTLLQVDTSMAPGTGHSFFQRPGIPLDQAGGFPNPATNPLRFGWILGASYQAGNRFMIDVMLQQAFSRQTHIPNEQVRRVYNMPFVRFTLGYKLYQ